MRQAWIFVFLLQAAFAQSGLLGSKIASISEAAQGRVGVACSFTGAPLDCNWNAHSKLPMQSVYKLPIAMAVLDAVEHGKLSLTSSVRFLPSDLISPHQYSPLRDRYPKANVDVKLQELLRLAVSESDGIASDILLREIGGPHLANTYVRRLGISGIAIRSTEKTLGQDARAQYRNYAEPAAMVQLLERLANQSPLSPEHTAMLLKWMTETETGKHRIKGLLPLGTLVAHKTGTSSTDGGLTPATNDVGLVTLPNGQYLAIAVFVSDSPATESVRDGVIARIARAIWDASLDVSHRRD
jgi:beta-lactamase class A